MTDEGLPQLYLVSPPRLVPAGFADQLRAALDGGPIACFQLWQPDASDDDIARLADILKPILDAAETAFVLNGNPALAKTLGLDGVHFDAASPKDIKQAKQTLGGDSIVGVSCYASRHLAMEAAEAGADYVSFGPVFDTETKQLAADPDALTCLTWWAEMMEVPCVAVGGITPETLPPVLQSGCEFLCVVSAIWNAPEGPEAAMRAFHNGIARVRQK